MRRLSDHADDNFLDCNVQRVDRWQILQRGLRLCFSQIQLIVLRNYIVSFFKAVRINRV